MPLKCALCDVEQPFDESGNYHDMGGEVRQPCAKKLGSCGKHFFHNYVTVAKQIESGEITKKDIETRTPKFVKARAYCPICQRRASDGG